MRGTPCSKWGAAPQLQAVARLMPQWQGKLHTPRSKFKVALMIHQARLSPESPTRAQPGLVDWRTQD